jgi:hypothetical protein
VPRARRAKGDLIEVLPEVLEMSQGKFYMSSLLGIMLGFQGWTLTHRAYALGWIHSRKTEGQTDGPHHT